MDRRNRLSVGVFRFPRASRAAQTGEEWRVNFSRVEWRTVVEDGKYVKPAGEKEDNWVWSPQGIVNMHVPDRWGFIRFAEL